MARFTKCLAVVKRAIGGNLDEDELAGLYNELERRVRSEDPRGGPDYSPQVLRKIADEMGIEIAEHGKIQAVMPIKNEIVKRTLAADISRYETPGKGLAAKIAGTDKMIEGGRLSTDARGQAISYEYFGGLIGDLRKEKLLEVWQSNVLEREVARELAEIRPNGRPGISGSREARQIATIVHKYQQIALRRMNRAGVPVYDLRGYIAKQSHNIDQVRRAGFEKWRAFILPRLDPAKTFAPLGLTDPQEINGFLRRTFEKIVTGGIYKEGLEEGEALAFRGQGKNLVKKLAAQRFLHFKDSDSFIEYNKRFGTGSLVASIHQALEKSARSIALIEDWGPNPQAMLDTLLKALRVKSVDDPAKLKSVTGWSERHIRNLFAEIDGSGHVPVSSRMSMVGRMIRQTHNLSKLGGVLLSSLVDPAVISSEFRYQGERLLGSYLKTLNAFLEGRSKGLQRETADLIGVGLDGIRGGILARFSNDDMVPGLMGRMVQTFFRLSGLTGWTDTWKTGVGLMMSRELGKSLQVPYEELSESLRRVLSQYSIDGKTWDLIRSTVPVKDAEGLRYVTPAIVGNMTDGKIALHLGLDLTDPLYPQRIERFRDELATRIRAYIVDRVDYAVLSPGAREQAMLHLGTQPGTPMGEAVRFVTQFKSFPFTYGTKISGRELSKGKLAGTLGLVHLALATTVLGYVAKSAKDIAVGRTPRDPREPGTWAASFIQGGGAGLYGDYLLGEYSRFGNGFVASIMGPTAANIEDFHDLYQRAVRGEDFAARGFRMAVQSAPFVNLFYTRAALDYLLFHRIQETMNPGYLRRMEKRVKEQNHQTFIIPPSSVIPYGGGVRR